MPAGYGWLEKSDEMHRVDEYFGVDDVEELDRRYADALERLSAGGSFSLDSGEWKSNPEVGESLAHFGNHWMNRQWWPNVAGEDVAGKLRDGFAAAITTAREQALPLSVVWVTSDPDYRSTHFEVDHVAGARAVVVVISTPYPKRLSRSALGPTAS